MRTSRSCVSSQGVSPWAVSPATAAGPVGNHPAGRDGIGNVRFNRFRAFHRKMLDMQFPGNRPYGRMRTFGVSGTDATPMQESRELDSSENTTLECRPEV